ncbi:hypothetical protein PoB_000248200 [Plakobranchus ocellatus]|uniref:Uncharacterized protein n=1 Tax=Plakobranchus ocellatus TaxID=259542 RepID=A0AAV3XZP0_9GAST|nr:hypothetical protein PoB_000248200 [Plakobranchus ocellatus]
MLWGIGGTVASESALRSAGTLLTRIRTPLPAPWPDVERKSLRSHCYGLAICNTQLSLFCIGQYDVTAQRPWLQMNEWFQYSAHSTNVKNPGVVLILGTQYKCKGSRRNSDTRCTLTMIHNKTTKAHRGDEKSSLTELTDITGAAVAMPHKSQSALTPASYKHPS